MIFDGILLFAGKGIKKGKSVPEGELLEPVRIFLIEIGVVAMQCRGTKITIHSVEPRHALAHAKYAAQAPRREGLLKSINETCLHLPYREMQASLTY